MVDLKNEGFLVVDLNGSQRWSRRGEVELQGRFVDLNVKYKKIKKISKCH